MGVGVLLPDDLWRFGGGVCGFSVDGESEWEGSLDSDSRAALAAAARCMNCWWLVWWIHGLGVVQSVPSSSVDVKTWFFLRIAGVALLR